MPPLILAQHANDSGCGQYRILQPALALQEAALARVVAAHDIATQQAIFEKADSVVLQVHARNNQLEWLTARRAQSNAFFVQDLDDHVTALPAVEVHAPAMPADIDARVRQTAQMCDRLVVSTQALAEIYRDLCDDIRVVPNRLDATRWSGLVPVQHRGGKPRVGWAGSSSHLRDLLMIEPLVAALASEVDWVFFGFCPDALLPYVQEFHHGVAFDAYPGRLARLGLDLALAPLVSDSFNDAKSNLKLLEYGVLGYAVICSDVSPYRGDLPVQRLPNDMAAWVDTIRAMLADRDALKQQGARLKVAVERDWMLQQHLAEWRAAWLP
jgi:hypothetical protein